MAAGTLVCGGAIQARPAAAHRPNVIVILADDIGYSDIGAYGGEIDTPNLDALAARSLRFTDFNTMSRCCPSRASLLTGRYPHRVGMAGNGTSLSRDVPTLAEELRGAGYATTMVGKWHLTAAKALPDPAEHLKWLNHQGYLDRDFGDRSTYPVARGFDHHWGIIWGIADYDDPFSLVNDYEPVRSVPADFYLTDAISDHAVSEVRRLGTGTKPFFLYLAYTAAHWPLMAPEATIQKYLARYRAGWDAIRRDRFARQVGSGLVDPGAAHLPAVDNGYPANTAPGWDALGPQEREAQARKMATHAAMIDIMDQGIGRVIAALKASGQYDDTMVLFMSDNGASPEIMVRPGYDRPSETRDGQPIAYGEYPDGIGTERTMGAIGAQWASAANTPWRFWKAESYRGGTQSPLLLSWPSHMTAAQGRLVRDRAHIIDIFPTVMAAARAAPTTQGKPPVDGVSLLPALQRRHIAPGRKLYWEHYGARAVSDGHWKLVELAPRAKQPSREWSLFDLRSDPTEMHDIAAAKPGVVTKLKTAWSRWASAVGVPERDRKSAD